MYFISHSEEETKKIGKKIAAGFKGGEVLALRGDLGTGKTVLAKGIAEGLGYKGIVNSPTFVLMKIYRVKFRVSNLQFSKKSVYKKENVINKAIKNICHIDAYRISDAHEIEDIGALEYFLEPSTVSIIEWPEKIKEILPQNAIFIELGYGKNEGDRIIRINEKRGAS
ncbi:MAG: tRNA (adenosine(37)-N6)-threonylcarbamoyltransferase complex ATPase subunit type 1 TsaE [bacterium]